MHITREADYAIRCVLHLTEHIGEPVSVDDIAETQGIPRTFTAKILQRLVKADILKSTRGPKGGFMLSRQPACISLLDVIEAIQGPVALNLCVIDSKYCNRSSLCSVHPVWVEINGEFRQRLSECTFEEFTRTGMRKKDKCIHNKDMNPLGVLMTQT
jgi:Rrf2 family protein